MYKYCKRRVLAAGIFFVLPCIESYTKVDLRTVSFDVPPQQVLTKDAVTVNVDAVVYYRRRRSVYYVAACPTPPSAYPTSRFVLTTHSRLSHTQLFRPFLGNRGRSVKLS